jgi:hypothetical protein
LFSNSIELVVKAPVSHVALYTGYGNVLESIGKGTFINNLTNIIKERKYKEVYIKVPKYHIDSTRMENVINEVLMKKPKYSVGELFWHLIYKIRKFWGGTTNLNKTVCSKTVGYCMHKATNLFPKWYTWEPGFIYNNNIDYDTYKVYKK